MSGRTLGFVDGPNLYTYVVQNPWTKFDPEGLDSQDTTQAGVTPTRDGHHVSPVQTWDKNGLSHDTQEELDKVRLSTPDDVDHGWSKAHKTYNERVDDITGKFVAEAKQRGVDPSKLSGKEAKEFATELVNQIQKDEYVQKFNGLVQSGASTTELNAMREQMVAKGMSAAEISEVAAVAKKLGWVSKAAKKLPVIGAVVTAVSFGADAHAEGVETATKNAIKSATMYDVTVQPVGEWTNKTFDQAQKGQLNPQNPIGNSINQQVQMNNFDPNDPSTYPK